MLIEVLGALLGATAFVVGFEAAIEQNEIGRVEDRLDAFRERIALDPPDNLERIDAGWEGFTDAYMPDLYRTRGRRRPLVFLWWILPLASVVSVVALSEFRGTFTRISVIVTVLLVVELALVMGGWVHRRHLGRRLEESISRVGLGLIDYVHESVINPLFLVPDEERNLEPDPSRVRIMQLIYRWAMGALRQVVYAEKHLRRYWDETKLGGFDDLVRSHYSVIDIAGSYLVGNHFSLPLLSVSDSDAALLLYRKRVVVGPGGAWIVAPMTIQGMPETWEEAWKGYLQEVGSTWFGAKKQRKGDS